MARILHVDDLHGWREIVRRALPDHRVDVAGSSEEALDLLRGGAAYHLALVDLRVVPDREIVGAGLLGLLRSRYPETRAIAVAAVRRVPEVERLYATVIGRSALDTGLAELDGASLPFRMPKPDELPSVPDADVDATLDVSAYRAARLAALRAHRTQVALSDGSGRAGRTTAYAMSNGVAQPLLDVEEIVLLAGEPVDGSDDLFGGAA